MIMRNQVKQWIETGKVDVFVGYKMFEGHPLPHFFTKENIKDVQELIDGPVRYPLEKIAGKLYERNPNLKIGMIARDCNQRTLNVLYIWNQMDPHDVETVPLNCCPSMLKENAVCSYLEPGKQAAQKRAEGIDSDMTIEDFESFSQEERFNRWSYEFEKCIKCYGCRNVCPVCFCKNCSLEHPDLVGTGDLPVEVPIFHLIRAVHMAGRCIDCGLCEEACPVDIPLRLLYRKVNQIVVDVFDYKTGTDAAQSPFNILGDEVTLEPKKIKAA
jgi:formate dehydrogenase subunit beta